MRRVMRKVRNTMKSRDAEKAAILAGGPLSAPAPDKLYIVVLGGSVTMGVNCAFSPIDFDKDSRNVQKNGSPDIIINAYSTNDMHITAMNYTTVNNKTLAAVFDMQQSFVRSALSYGCGNRSRLCLYFC
mmetsp:Transcript_755/g.1210  ORF Transcript_755/g.1210 Transcript_755/m.1210 type:complete len:129 (-) Transcript_755:1476-1862(-)